MHEQTRGFRALQALVLAGLTAAGLSLSSVPVRAQVSGAVDRDLSQKPGDDSECAVAKNPANTSQIFVLCNTAEGGIGGPGGLFAARSGDGGATWAYPDPSDKTIADGDAGQGTRACCDPTLAWDTFGNLFITYIDNTGGNIATLLSTNGGVTFSSLATFAGSVDQPTVVAANTSAPGVPVAVWVVWNQSGQMVARGAAVTGLGVVGAFGALQTIPGTSGCSFGDVAIAPSGAVVQACQSPTGGQGPGTIYVNIDADGLGAGNFGSAIVATTTNVGGFDYIPPQNRRSVDAEAGLAFDSTPSSAHFGRLYFVYTDETANENNDTDIRLRYSDNNGATWSAPIRINDDPASPVRSQFLPRIATDAQNGNISVCWHDCRNSSTNTGMQVYCTIATPAGASPTFAANARISDGTSTSNGAGIEFGDYSGLAYLEGVAHPSWADTSNSTGNNPNGTANFDAVTDRVTSCSPGVPSVVSPANGATGVGATPTLDWSDVVDATSYDVQVATDAAFTSVVRSNAVATSSWTVTPSLANGTLYYWRARTNAACGSGNWSAGWTFTTQAVAAMYYPKTTATSHLVSSYPPCQGTGMSCQFLPNEDLLPRPASAGIVMHGGGYTGSCSLTGVQGCTEQEVEVFINDQPLTWPQWCLANNEAYTLAAPTRYDFRGVSVIGCTPTPFNFDYDFLCRSNADCNAGDTCSTVTGRCNPPSLTPVTLDAGYGHSVSAHADGTVWGWGLNTSGQLGDATLTNRSGPVRAGTLTGILEVGGGTAHTVALKSDGTVWAWGDNTHGQLGNGTTTSRSFPGQVPGLTGVVAVAAGASHNLAVKSDGSVWTWGYNWGGQIGDGTTNDRLSPFQVPGLSGVASVSGGFFHSIAVKTDGTVSTWGRNAEGELGDGTHTNRYTPGPVPGLTGVIRASAGAYFTMVVMNDGTLKGWGHNYFGQLGDGSNLERTSPVAATGISGVARVASGSAFTLAVKTDGTIWSWGQNVAGQLGSGNTTDRNTPAQIAGLSGMAEPAAGEDHSLARSTAGVVYGWGKNLYGQIGVGPWPRTTPAVITDETQVAPLALMAPAGGEIWAGGSAQIVSWTGAGPISVKISYDGGTTYTTLTASTALQDVPITVPANWSSGRGRVRIDRVGTPASFAQTGTYMRFQNPPTHAWSTTTVDNAPATVGEFASIAIDPFGRTGIAYTDRTNGDLKFALRSGTGWTIEPVDAVNSSGWYTSLAFGADGSPRISYMDGTRTYLRYAYKVAGSWVKEDVADTSCTLPTSLGFDTLDRPFIAIQDCSGTRVRLFAKSGTWSEIKFVTGASPSLRMEGNLPRISYYLHTTNPTQLHYLAASGTLGSFTWTDVTVTGGDGANASSITIDPAGNPSISFYAANTKSLRRAKRVSGTWGVEIVDASVGDIGNWNSIALDASSRPRISYLANGLVKVAEWNGATWQLDSVDGSGDTPAATAIAVDAAGNDRVAYFDAVNGDLRYAVSQQDASAPSAPTLLADAGRTTIAVSWTAVGDDGTTGTASSYEFRRSLSPINAGNFSQATLVPMGAPAPAGFTECAGFSSLTSCTLYYYGLKVMDDVGNESTLVTGQMVTDCSGSQELICN